MSHTASRKWTSDELREYEAYKRVSDHFQHIAPKSPALPTSLEEWIAHRRAMVEELRTAAKRKLDHLVSGCKKNKDKTKPAFGGKKFNDGRSSVLAMQSIWATSSDIESARSHAPWPTNAELKESGIYRASSGQRRLIPHPRMDANPSVDWKDRSLIELFPFDDPSQNNERSKFS